MLADAVESRVGVGDLHGDGIDVAEPDLSPEDFRGGDRQHPGAAADVEHRAWPAPLEQAVEMHEAAAGGAMMAGAEGEPRLDLDPDIIDPDLRAIMGAMHEKAAGAHRLEAGQRIGDPVLLLGEAESRRLRRLLVRRGDDQGADRLLVGLEGEERLDQPGLAAALPRILGLEGGGGGLRRFETLDDEVGDRAGAALVADQGQAIGGVVGRQAFSTSPSPVYGRRWPKGPDEGKRAKTAPDDVPSLSDAVGVSRRPSTL